MEKEMEKIKKHSRKRQAILDLLCTTTEHPSAEQIYTQLKGKFPDLSLATVYRNLSEFRREGVIISVATVGGNERFDARCAAHEHFICDICAGVSDLSLDMITKETYEAVYDETGGRPNRHSLNFYGICGGCAEKSSKL